MINPVGAGLSLQKFHNKVVARPLARKKTRKLKLAATSITKSINLGAEKDH